MKKTLIVILITAIATATGLYFRPSYPLIGQIDWVDVLTKGHFVGSVTEFLGQGFIDESFWYVMRYTMGGLIAGLMLVAFMATKKN